MIIALDSFPSLRSRQKLAFDWFDTPGLVEALQEVGPIDSLRLASREELETESQRLMANEIEFIDNPSFALPAAGLIVFDASLDLQREGNTRKPIADGLPPYLDRLCTAKLLTPEQESLLFQRMNFLLYTADQCRASLSYTKTPVQQIDRIRILLSLAEWHRDRIIEANLRLVFSIVKKFVTPQVTFDDLLADGMLALIRGVEKFDYSRGFRFSTYATQIVRRNSYQVVVQRQTDDSRTISGLDEAGIAESGVVRESFLPEQRWNQLRARLGVLLDSLTRREKLIIRARFSIGAHSRVQTLQAIASRLGISKERVRQIEARAITKLQEMAAETDLQELGSL